MQTAIQNSKNKKRMVLFTQDAHFSIKKAATIFEQDHLIIKSKNDGKMDLEDLEKVVAVIKREGYEYLVLMPTLGTTFKGAVDDLDGMLSVCFKFYPREQIYIHLDAAFFGGFWLLSGETPRYYLGDHFDSYSVSSHKFYGGMVASCFFTNRKVDATPAEYLQTDDKEISGSKNGLNPLLWRARLRQFDWKQEYQRCRLLAKALQDGLTKRNLPNFCHPHSVIVVFPEPSDKVCDEFQLTTLKHWAHVCVMAHISLNDINAFLNKLDSTGDTQKMASTKFEKDSTGWPSHVVSG